MKFNERFIHTVNEFKKAKELSNNIIENANSKFPGATSELQFQFKLAEIEAMNNIAMGLRQVSDSIDNVAQNIKNF